ncbi:MAG: hypothetical protein JNK64_21940 [Myxococcales bacterium]|nr:hypothetical protein [Myxococcales bacterium]
MVGRRPSNRPTVRLAPATQLTATAGTFHDLRRRDAMNGKDLALDVANVAWDVLQTLTSSLKFWQMNDLPGGIVVPQLDLGTDWSSAVARVRAELDSGALVDAERMARVAYLADLLIDRVRAVLDLSSGPDVLAWLRPMAAHSLLTLVTKPGRRTVANVLVWAAAAVLLLDVRVQESLLGASPVHRAEHGLWALLEQYGTDEAKAVATLVGIEAIIEFFVRSARDDSHLAGRHWRAGFDVPAFEPLPGGAPPDPLAVAREAARWTVAIENHRESGGLSPIGDYDAFDPPAPAIPPVATGFRSTFVAVPPSSRFEPADTSRPAMVHVSLGGDVATTWHLGEDTLSASVGGDAGVLVPAPVMTWDFPWNWDWKPPGSFVEVTGALEAALTYSTGLRPRADRDPDGVSLTVDRFVTEGRISVSGAALPPVGVGVVSARVDVEGVTLTIGRIPALDAVLEHGASASFDLGVLLNYPLGGSLEFGFRGAAGAELVLPIQRTFGDGDARVGVRQIRVRARAGRAGDSGDAPNQLALEVSGDFVAGIRGWTFAVDGVGVAVSVGGTEQPDGNLVGVAAVDWRPLWPTRVSIDCACPSFRGGGFAAYDASTDRWSGGGEFVAWDKLGLRALFLNEPALAAGRRSWLALATAEFPSPAWFVPKGVGVLYAHNRATDPTALLAAVAAGDLAAVLFPEDIAAHGPAYLATLGRLLPAAAAGWVAGLFVRFAGLDGNARVDLGIMYDGGAAARAYLLARVLVGLPTLSDPLVRVEVAALGVWDQARDEYELRAALVNSRAFGGELTGEALLFSGDPDRDDGRSERVRLMSIGGFHPRFVAPGPAIRVPERVTLMIERGDHLRLECRAYLAITPGALHAGIEASLLARFAGFGIRGNLGFDALFSPSLEFAIAIRVGVALYLGSRQLLGASFEGDFGVVSEDHFPTTYLRGRARISLWFFDYETPRFTLRLGRGGASTSVSRDPADALYEALIDRTNWDTGGTPGLLVRPAERAGWWASPSAPLRFTQTVVPVAVPITHFESRPLGAVRTLDLAMMPPAGAAWHAAPVDGEFGRRRRSGDGDSAAP